jgi:hypothetical protein
MWRRDGTALANRGRVRMRSAGGPSRLAIVVFVLAAAGVAGWRMWGPAATVRNARYLEFHASPDHDASDMRGAPLVRGYVLDVFSVGGSRPVQTIELGKPSPAADGTIRVELSSLSLTRLAPGTAYEAAVTAIGPYGRGESDRSNRFALTISR